MAPIVWHKFTTRQFNPGAPSVAFAAEWSDPSNYAFTVLLLLGGDVVSRALAQLAGGLVTPVAFSFGWVAYATSAINSAIGEMKLMPDPDTSCTVINGKTGYGRDNSSWVLGRMMRDYEFWMDTEVSEATEGLRQEKWKYMKEQEEKKHPGSGEHIEKPDHAGLVVSFWEPCETTKAATPGRDILFWSGILVCIVQLGIAAIPCGTTGDWGVLLVTGSAILLCLATGSLRQWRREKWACRKLNGKPKNVVLTHGNGAQHAIAIISDGQGLDLEDLATGPMNVDNPSISMLTRLITVAFGILWILLLITSSALVSQAWFLIAIGGIGMLQNMFVAGYSRRPEALGVPLKYRGVVARPKVMDTLLAVEAEYPKLGRNLLPTFFPADLRENEIKQWADLEEQQKKAKEQAKLKI